MKTVTSVMCAALSAICTITHGYADNSSALCSGKSCKKENVFGYWAAQNMPIWLGICDKGDKPSAELLWVGGEPIPQTNVKIDGATVTMRQDFNGRILQTTLKVNGDDAELRRIFINENGESTQSWESPWNKMKRIPPLPPAPDISKAVFGKPVDLLANGLDGWERKDPKMPFGWTFKDGILSNRPKHFGSGIVTKRSDFFDFRLSYDVRVLPKCDLGIFLRGAYEIKVSDSYGKPLDRRSMAALHGRIAPCIAAEKPAKEWQHVDVTLYRRHLTVVLNGVKVIDNAPILGFTGLATTRDESVPGPIYLHKGYNKPQVDFRNMILSPIEK